MIPYGRCNHKTISDHSNMMPATNKRLWVCSNCGGRAYWGPTWSYWGNIECPKCWTADIEWVACCDACAGKLREK